MDQPETGPCLYVVKVFSTVQGEGSLAGTPAVFVRLAGCNLWVGTEDTRDTGRGDCAAWCDTQFSRGQAVPLPQVLEEIGKCATGMACPLVVITGGEPMLQLRKPAGKLFVRLLFLAGYDVSIETNGMIQADFDQPVHITVSPKAIRSDPTTVDHISQRRGDVLKVVWPTTLPLKEMDEWSFQDKYLQPRDSGEAVPGSTQLSECIEKASVLGWRVSFQTHKMVGLE